MTPWRRSFATVEERVRADRIALGRSIAARRRVCGMTVDRFAVLLGLDVVAVDLLEEGVLPAGTRRLIQIAALLGTTVGALLADRPDDALPGGRGAWAIRGLRRRWRARGAVIAMGGR